MKLSIVIVNLNTRHLLETCLTSLEEHCHDVSHEIIVVDNHSSDGSVAMVKTRFPYVRVIENTENRRYAPANNQGLAEAQGDYVLFLNSDTVLQGDSIQEMMHFLDAHAEVGIVGAQLVYPDGRHQDACFRFPTPLNLFYLFSLARFYWKTPLAGKYSSRQLTSPHPVDFVMGACLLARRVLLVQCGGMDTDYYLYGEDTDLCYQIQQMGSAAYYLPTSSPVIHHGGASTDHLFGSEHRIRHLWGWKARFLFVRKHYHWRKIGVLMAMSSGFGLNALLYGLAAVKRWDWTYARSHLGVHWQILQEAFSIILR